MIGVSYWVGGQLIVDNEPVDTPFVVLDLRIGWWRLLRALLHREPLQVQVTIAADPETHLAVQDLLDAHPAGEDLLDVTARVLTYEARAAAAREHLDRLLDQATS